MPRKSTAVADAPAPAPDDRFFRFSVKCDREQNKTIERLARERGVTPTTFVQKHFETIFHADALGALTPAAAGEPAEDDGPALPSEIPTAPVHDDSDFDRPSRSPSVADRVMTVLRGAADEDGTVSMPYREIGRRAGCAPQSAARGVESLLGRDAITIVREARPGRHGYSATYRIIKGAEA